MKRIITILLLGIVLGSNAQTFKVINIPTKNLGFGVNTTTSNMLLLVVNGPLLSAADLTKPVGGYIDQGIQKQPWVSPESGGGNFANQNGIFGMKPDGTMVLYSYENRNYLPKLHWGFQNGMMLVLNSKNICNSNSTNKGYRRSGIGFRGDNTLVFIMSLENCTFWDLGQEFIKEGCTNAIYLDGFDYIGYSQNGQEYGFLPGTMKLQFYRNK